MTDTGQNCPTGVCKIHWEKPGWDKTRRVVGLVCKAQIVGSSPGLEVNKLAFLAQYKQPREELQRLFVKTEVGVCPKMRALKALLLVFIPESLEGKRITVDAVATVLQRTQGCIESCFHKERRIFCTSDPTCWES